MTDDPALVSAVSIAMVEHGVAVTARSTSMNPAAHIPEIGVQCVVVDASSLALLHELERHAQALSGRLATRPAFVAVLGSRSTEDRLRALRAGADHVWSSSEDPVVLGRKLSQVLSTRCQEPLRVMIIDDERSQRMFSEAVLRRFGIQTVRCENLDHARREFEARIPDVVLIDLHMPEIDGLAMVDQLLEFPGSEAVSILFLSGNAEPDTRFDALVAGGDDFLMKPIQPRHLLRAVWAHGRRAQRRRRLIRAAVTTAKV